MTTLADMARDDTRSIVLDLIRGAACVMVVVYHLNTFLPTGLGQGAMELFFVLSGYLIAKSLTKSVHRDGWAGVKEFALRRVRRLMPAMVGFLAGAILLNLWLTDVVWSELTWASVSSLLGWYNFYWLRVEPSVIGYGGIWSLSLEEQFYVTSLLVVLLLRLITNRPAVWLGTLAVLLLGWGLGWRIAAYTGVYEPPWVPYIAYLPLLRYWGFGLGVFIAWLERVRPLKMPQHRGLTIGWTLIILGLMGWLIDSVAFYDANTFMLQWLLVPVGGAALIRLAPAIDAGLVRGFEAMKSWPTMMSAVVLTTFGAWRLIGVASYSIYLWHCIVLAGFRHEDMFGPTWLWWFMAFLSLLTGLLSWKFIELRYYSFGGRKRIREEST
ncbi:MAG: hypothetical protein SynsKO_18740 [Synoicihabitans sp.]